MVFIFHMIKTYFVRLFHTYTQSSNYIKRIYSVHTHFKRVKLNVNMGSKLFRVRYARFLNSQDGFLFEAMFAIFLVFW